MKACSASVVPLALSTMTECHSDDLSTTVVMGAVASRLMSASCLTFESKRRNRIKCEPKRAAKSDALAHSRSASHSSISPVTTYGV